MDIARSVNLLPWVGQNDTHVVFLLLARLCIIETRLLVITALASITDLSYARIFGTQREISPNGFVLKLNGENYTTYDDLLRLISFFDLVG